MSAVWWKIKCLFVRVNEIIAFGKECEYSVLPLYTCAGNLGSNNMRQLPLIVGKVLGWPDTSFDFFIMSSEREN